ncbi:glycosyltransferase family 2 protein [Virgibacillus sp. JSM 102003]|uniref:glycosyltransferase family 2 protein n=1 Tax=Virgibacillus sp. JSM 102003 TaxID=1562108 RepID=UPI0035C02D6D
MNPKISIIVPVFNVELYIRKCINSILAQTFKDFELILVNDGSPDNCGEICDEYAKNDNRIRVVHKENGGVSSARNRGIDIARGDYIGFVDPDDYVEPTMYEELNKSSVNHSAEIVVCQIKTVNLFMNETSISSVWPKVNCSLDKNCIEEQIIPSILSNKYFSLLSSCNKLYKKSLFEDKNHRFDENKSHGEDARLNIILLTHIHSIVFVNQPLYKYYIRERKSLTRIFNEDLYDYLVDNKNFGILLCHRYNLTENISDITNDFSLKSLVHMQSVVNSNLTITKKFRMIRNIMNDSDFNKYIFDCKCPSTYYKLLKRICIQKNEKLFTMIVKIKVNFQSYLANFSSVK